jgi:DNA methylase
MSGLIRLDELRKELAALISPVTARLKVGELDALLKYAKAIKASQADQNRIAEVKLRYMRRGGELLAAIPRAQGRERLGLRATLAQSEIAETTAKRWQVMAGIPGDEFESALAAFDDDDLTAAALLEFLKERARAARSGPAAGEYEPSSEADIRCCSMQELLTDANIHPDWIITDPPYPAEFVPLFGELARLSGETPMAVMSGQYHFHEVLSVMVPFRKPRWIMCYLTPGKKHQQFPSKIHTAWKPVILFGGEEWIPDDVFTSTAPDKDHHDWGQSVSGMVSLIERLTHPGQLVCDPFVGGGATAVACATTGRRFIGCDVDEESVNTSRARVREGLDDQRAS